MLFDALAEKQELGIEIQTLCIEANELLTT
jgi:hypothetical protein